MTPAIEHTIPSKPFERIEPFLEAQGIAGILSS
jgi:hypothetical protein